MEPAKSATDTVRVRYHIRRADVDLDALDKTQQRRVGEFLAENDPAAARAFRRMDQDTVDDLTRVEMDAQTRSEFVAATRKIDDSDWHVALTKYEELDERKAEYGRLIRQNDESAVRFLSNVDQDNLDALFGTCQLASSAGLVTSGGVGAGPVRHPSVGLTKDCGLSDATHDEYYKQIFDTAEENDDISTNQILKQFTEVTSQTRRDGLKRLFAATGEDGIRFIRDIDTDTQKAVFDIKEDVDNFDKWTSWRESLVGYNVGSKGRNDLSTEDIETHIKKVK